MRRTPAVYILASRRNGTLYIGVTGDLLQKVWLHKMDLADGFTKEYGVHMLVYYEIHQTMSDAIRREKQIITWDREWKRRLIEKQNPYWRDLSEDLIP